MPERRDAADGETGGGADKIGVGPHDRLAEPCAHCLLVDAVCPRDQEKIGAPTVFSLEYQRLDDLADGAAAGRRGLLGGARGGRHDPDCHAQSERLCRLLHPFCRGR